MKKGIIVVGAALWLLMVAGQSTGEMKITPDGVTFPNASEQTMAATPPWSQKLAAERFQLVMNDEAVLDKETGLVWQRATDDTSRYWGEACTYCYNLILGGRGGWRLPTVEELSSLVDPSQIDPALPDGHPFLNVKLVYPYWSSSTRAGYRGDAWYVYFDSGYTYESFKYNDYYVRCVRGGHGCDGGTGGLYPPARGHF